MAAAAEAVGYRKLRLDSRRRAVTLLVPKMQLDLGGIAKGYAADQALQLLKEMGVNRALVAASGDIALGEPPPGQRGWKVAIAAMNSPTDQPAAERTLSPGIQTGADTNVVATRFLLSNCGISTSGDAEQSIEIDGVRYSRILDPRLRLGLTNRIQATIIAPNATTSDPLATAICVLGPKRGLALVNALPGTAAFILIKRFDDQATTAAAFLAGHVDLIVTGSAIAAKLIKDNPSKMIETKYIMRQSPCHIGVRKGATDLLNWVNVFIYTHKLNGDLDKLSLKWFGEPLPAFPQF